MSSKLLPNLLLGAAAGVVAGAVISKAQDRALAGKPAVPTALLASLGGLLPLGKVLALRVVATIDQIEKAAVGADNDDFDADRDNGGDHLSQDENGADRDEHAGTPAGTTGTPAGDEHVQEPALADMGHPAGPGYAPTPA